MRINSFTANKFFQFRGLLPINQEADDILNKSVRHKKYTIIENTTERNKFKNTIIAVAAVGAIFMLVLNKGEISLGILGGALGSLLGAIIGLFRSK